MKNGWRFPTFASGAAAFVVFLVNIVPMLVWDSVHDTSLFIVLLIISSLLIAIFARSLQRRALLWLVFNVISIGLATVILFFITRRKIQYTSPKDIDKQQSIFRVYDELPKIKIPKDVSKYPPLQNESQQEIHKILSEMTDIENEEQITPIVEMGAGAVPVLLQHLQTNNKTPQIFTILQTMKSQAYPAIPTLVDFIERGEHMYESISVLGSIGNKSAATIPMLSCIVKNTAMKKNIRAKAVEALGDIGELSKNLYELLIRCCEEAPRQIATNAIRALGKLASYSKDLEDFLLETLSKDEMTHAILEALQRIGSHNVLRNKTFQHLLISSQDNTQKASEEAFTAIIHRHGIDKEMLENQELDEKIKLKATTLFLELQPESEYLFSVLQQSYRPTSDKMIKKDIQQVLELITEKSTVAIPFLIELFGEPKGDFHSIAKDKLCAMGSTATQAIPALRKMVYDKNAKIQVRATQTLMCILQEKDLSQFLTTALRNKTSQVRITAAKKLVEMSPNIAFAIDDLQKALTDEVQEVRNTAQKALDRV